MSVRRIAVLGGGMGSLAAVYALTSLPRWQERFSITVYQQGWRLGGKGASGRNLAHAHRIEEHGFHIWMGFYHNAFRVMRECYAERQQIVPDPGLFRDWQDAFLPQRVQVLVEHIENDWRPWLVSHPDRAGMPGVDDTPLTPWQHVQEMLRRLRAAAADVEAHREAVAGSLEHPVSLFNRVRARLAGDVAVIGAMTEFAVLDAAIALAGRLGDDLPAHDAGDHGLLIDLVDHARERGRAALAGALDRSDEARRLLIVFELGVTLLRGVLVDRIWSRGFDAIDNEEFRAWLRRHGAGALVLYSALLDSLYTAGFCFVAGDPARPDMAAGVALQSFLRIFLRQQGPFSWKMRSGMGDIVFTPLYQVLQARGVHFAFFHRVTRLAFDAATRTIPRIDLEQQAQTPQPYQPLIRVNEVDAWPSSPLCDQIEHGDELAAAIADGTVNFESSWSARWPHATPLTLTRGDDYDEVILGISLAALGSICGELVDALPPWQTMLDRVGTVATQAQQLWLRPSLTEIGWTQPPAVTQGYPAALGQWLDASHVIERETWPANRTPGTVLYACYALPDLETAPPPGPSDYQTRSAARVEAMSREWLSRYTGLEFPGAVQPGTPSLDPALLCESPLTTADPLASQYWRANVEPSERFVLSPTGATEARLPVDGSGVDGLYLTGDWVRNGFNVGCIEATVISGLQCARAVSGAAIAITDEHFFVHRPRDGGGDG